MLLFSKSMIVKQTNRIIISFVRNYEKVGILGVPFEDGQAREGVSNGPAAIRQYGILKELQLLGNDVVDFGDVTYDDPGVDPKFAVGNMKKLGHVAEGQKQTSTMVEKILNDGYNCLVLGGDHSLGIGSIDGHVKAKKDVSVLWIDAHADLNTAVTSPSGNIHGMPVALLVKELSEYWPYLHGMDWLQPQLSIQNVAYIGLRDIDAYERLIIEKFHIQACGMEDIGTYGISEVVRMCLDHIDPHQNRSIHVSFDIDALDPLEAPSTGTAVRGGLTLREGIQIMEEVHRTGRLHAVDLVEVNPSIGDERDLKLTLQAAQYIIKAAFGMNRHGLLLPHHKEIPFPEETMKEPVTDIM